jgi:threonine dehydratase
MLPTLKPPTLEDVLAARRTVAPYLPPTPLVRVGRLSERLGCEFYLKCENLQPVGAFKVRGGVNLVARLSDHERQAGLVAASTGNHGQSIAFAARAFDVTATIFVPAENVNPVKVAAMEALGARVRHHGRDFDEAREACEREAEETGARYVHSANEPLLVAGVATMALEILDAIPHPDVILVPVGGGSGASAQGIVARALSPVTRVIGVQSEAAPGLYRAWRSGSLEPCDVMGTEHEGLATRVPFHFTLDIIRETLADFVLVSEAAINDAVRTLALNARLVAEGAGAAATAAAIQLGDQLRGRTVVAILSGGNIPADRLARILDP